MRKSLFLLVLIASSTEAFASPNDEALIVFIKKSCLNTNPNISEAFKKAFINESLREHGLTERTMMEEVFHPEADKRLDALTWYYNDKWCEKFASEKASLSLSARRAGSKIVNSLLNSSPSVNPALANQGLSPGTQKRCIGDWCMSNGERSSSGHLLPKGWYCREQPRVVSCHDEINVKRVPHKGQQSRYIAKDSLFYIYRNPTAGTLPSTTQISPSITNCYGNTGSFSCTTQPPVTLTNPGKAADPGGWVIQERTVVVDCDQQTYATYKGGRLIGKWKRLGSLGRFTNSCRNASSLKPSSLKL